MLDIVSRLNDKHCDNTKDEIYLRAKSFNENGDQQVE